MNISKIFSLIIIVILLMSCSDSGSSDSSPTGTSPQLYDVTVSMTPSDGGTISPSPDSSYEEGSQVSLQANPTDAYTFSGWSGTIDTTANPVTITVEKNYNLTANFQIKSYELSVSTTGEGTVSEQIVQQKTDYEHGTVVELTANPAEGWKFVEWQGDITGATNPTQITVDNPKSVTAILEKKTFPLTINISGNGSVTKSPDQGEYEFGTIVDLTANPDTGWEFETWDGDTVGTNNPITISIDSAITVTAVFTNPTFAGGNGTIEYPYQISTIDELQAINDYPTSHFIQINDIDASATSTWNGGAGFKPIGDNIVHFRGSFNGNNYKILNLNINRDGYVGLFGYTNNATLKDVILENVNIQGGFTRTGALVGEARNNSKIENSYSTGEVNSNGITGGLIGWLFVKDVNAEGKVINSFSNCIVTGGGASGGLLGANYRGLVINSYSTGNVFDSNGQVGGLIGANNGIIENSYSQSIVDGNASSMVGGLVGDNQTSSAEIKQSYAKGSVSGGTDVGGLVGSNKGKVLKSYSKGDVSGNERIGGLIGSSNTDGTINQTFSIGLVSGSIDIGGLIGVNGSTVTASYWDTESSSRTNGVGRGTSDGTTGLTTNEMTGTSAETNMSAFDFVNIWDTTSSYPALLWE